MAGLSSTQSAAVSLLYLGPYPRTARAARFIAYLAALSSSAPLVGPTCATEAQTLWDDTLELGNLQNFTPIHPIFEQDTRQLSASVGCISPIFLVKVGVIRAGGGWGREIAERETSLRSFSTPLRPPPNPTLLDEFHAYPVAPTRPPSSRRPPAPVWSPVPDSAPPIGSEHSSLYPLALVRSRIRTNRLAWPTGAARHAYGSSTVHAEPISHFVHIPSSPFCVMSLAHAANFATHRGRCARVAAARQSFGPGISLDVVGGSFGDHPVGFRFSPNYTHTMRQLLRASIWMSCHTAALSTPDHGCPKIRVVVVALPLQRKFGGGMQRRHARGSPFSKLIYNCQLRGRLGIQHRRKTRWIAMNGGTLVDIHSETPSILFPSTLNSVHAQLAGTCIN
ncbi:hypothetical protein C8J57DRAFT_1245898 [Mycena rebaudengoi]|nr:hypothetical protein C8J57DRAFT_1245898 [Mycena rebaudengoi]